VTHGGCEGSSQRVFKIAKPGAGSRLVILQAVTNVDAVLLGDFRSLTHVG
jgi:hypothetical protein